MPTKPTEKPPVVLNNEKAIAAIEEDKLELQIEQVGKITPPDGGYGWVVVLASFLVNMAVDGVIYTCAPIVLPIWGLKFGSKTLASIAHSTLVGCYYLCGPLASAFVNVFGIRSVAIGGSVLATTGFLLALMGGIGFGCMYLPSIVVLSQYFEKKRSLATGIAVCGSGIGTMLFAALNNIIFPLVGGNVENFLVYLAAVAISGAIFSLFFRPLTASDKQVEKVARIVSKFEGEQGEATRDLLEKVRTDLEELNRPGHQQDTYYAGNADALDKKEKHVVHVTEQHTIEHTPKKSALAEIKTSLASIWDTELLCSPSFMTLAISGTLTVLAFLVPFTLLSDEMKQKGYEKEHTEKALMVIGGSNIVFRIICGAISDHPKLSALQVSNIASIIAGTSMLFVPFCTEFWHYMAFCVVFAAGVACFAALRSVIAVELIGVEKLNTAFGIMMVFMGIGAVTGAPLASALRDLTGNYNLSFYVMGVIFAFSGIMTIRLPQIKAWEEQRRRSRVGVEMRVISQSSA
ncbi:unnamed protein product [Caenorhabditis sp. 36 PRJEB53466]|nr:unnamed protein product [Caenorhabditis sp. 36 PRJEB53466]